MRGFFIFGFIGFLVAKFFSGKKEGQQGRLKSLKFRIGNYTLHFHHYLIALALMMSLSLVGYYNNSVFGLLTGIAVQGFTYKDFHRIIYKEH